jgi:hypothetical protein
MSWLRRLWFAKRDLPPDALRNEGLELAMDWGEQWLSPIQERLRQRHPAVAALELDAIDAECQAAMRLGHETVHAFVRDGVEALSAERLAPVLRASHSWISDENVERLFRQSLYYATKAGGPARTR